MKSSEFHELSEEELKVKEKELRENILHLRFQHAMGQLENTMRLRSTKKDIARIKTVLRTKGKEKAS